MSPEEEEQDGGELEADVKEPEIIPAAKKKGRPKGKAPYNARARASKTEDETFEAVEEPDGRGPQRKQEVQVPEDGPEFGPGEIEPPMPLEFQRLFKALKTVVWDSKMKRAVWEEWKGVPPELQRNPYFLRDALLAHGMEPHKAHYVMSLVFRPDGQYGFSYQPYSGYPAPGYAQPPPQGHLEEPEVKKQTMKERMMDSAVTAYELRLFTQAMAPVLDPGGGGGGMDLVMEKDKEDNPVRDANGLPVFKVVPRAPNSASLAALMNQRGNGDSVDPTKFMTTILDAFTKGVEVASKQNNGGGQQQVLDLQNKLYETQLTAIKGGYDASEKRFDAEKQRIEDEAKRSSFEAQIEQAKKWKEAGLFGGTDKDAQLLNIRFEMYKMQEEEKKARALAEISAKATEAQEGRQQFQQVADLLKNATDKALAPVTDAIALGLRDRFSGRGAPGAPAAPQQQEANYGTLTPEQQVQYQQKFSELRMKLDAEQAKLNQAMTTRQQVQVEQVQAAAASAPSPSQIASPLYFKCDAPGCTMMFRDQGSLDRHKGEKHPTLVAA